MPTSSYCHITLPHQLFMNGAAHTLFRTLLIWMWPLLPISRFSSPCYIVTYLLEVSDDFIKCWIVLQLDTSQTQLRNDFQHLKFSMDTLSTILEKRYTDMMNLDTIHRKIRSATADFHVLADSLKRDIKLHQDGIYFFAFHLKRYSLKFSFS